MSTMNLLMDLNYFEKDEVEKIRGLRIDLISDIIEFNNGSEWIELAQLKDAPSYQTTSEKGENNGYSPLNSEGKIPDEHLVKESLQGIYLVDTLTERNNITGQTDGDLVFVKSHRRSYVWDEELQGWTLQSVLNKEDINVLWENITNTPSEFTPDSHGNEAHIVEFATQVDLENLESELNNHKSRTYDRSTLSKTWTINHNLGRQPDVSIIDENGQIIYGEIHYIDLDTVEINFNSPTKGKAVLK